MFHLWTIVNKSIRTDEKVQLKSIEGKISKITSLAD